MDFVSGLSRTAKGNDSIWVIMDRLTKSVHFLPTKINHLMEKLVEMCIREIVNLHGIPLSIGSERDLRSTSKFWAGLHNSFGTKLKLSAACHPQMNG